MPSHKFTRIRACSYAPRGTTCAATIHSLHNQANTLQFHIQDHYSKIQTSDQLYAGGCAYLHYWDHAMASGF